MDQNNYQWLTRILGVTVSADLRWHRRVDNVCLKASRTLNFIRRNVYHCSPEAKHLAYTSLIRPQLEYAVAAWDPYTARDTAQLEKVQRRAARFAKKDFRRTTSATQLLSDLSWNQLADRRGSARLCMLFKAIHGLAAIPTDSFQRPSRATRYSTEHTFINLSCRIDAYRFSFFPRTIVDWNALTEAVRLKPSVDSFRAALQTHHPPSCY